MLKKDNIKIFVAFLIIIGGLFIYNYYRKSYIFEDFNIVGGKIIDYAIIGDFNTKYVKYEYNDVDGKIFYREIDATIGIDSCYHNLLKCQTYRLLVVYSNQDHSKSLINLKRQYIEGENINKKSLSLDNFE